MAEKLSIQVGLEGGDQVEQEFKSIGTTGETSLKKITTAANELNSTIATTGEKLKGAQGVASGVASIENAFVGLAEAVGIVVGAIVAAEAAMFGFVKSASQVAESISKMQDAAGGSAENLSTASLALQTFGATASGVEKAIVSLGQRGAEAMGTLARDVQASAEKIVNAQENLNRLRLQSERQDLQSVELAVQAAVRRRSLTEGREIKPAPEVRELFAAQQANQRLQELDEARTENARKQADARRKILEDQANDLQTLMTKLEGFRRISFDPLTTFPNVLKAVQAELDRFSDPQDKIRAFLIIFDQLKDKTLAFALAAKLGLSDFVKDLGDGELALSRFVERQEKIKELGIGLSAEDTENLRQFRNAWDELSTVIGAVLTKLGAFAAPAVTAGIQLISTEIKKLIADFNELGKSMKAVGESNLGKLLFSKVNESVNALNQLLSIGVSKVLEKSGVSPETIKKIQDNILGIAGAANKAEDTFDDTSDAIDRTGEAAKKAAKQLADIVNEIAKIKTNIANIQAEGLLKLQENADRAAKSIESIRQRLADLQRQITEQGIEKGIIDPMTGGPVAGMEEAFDRLQQQRLRAQRKAQEEENRINQETDDRRRQIQDSIDALIKKELERKQILEAQSLELQKQLGLVQASQSASVQEPESTPRLGETKAEFEARQAAGAKRAELSAAPLIDFSGLIQSAESLKTAFDGLANGINNSINSALDKLLTNLSDLSRTTFALSEQFAQLVQRMSQPAAVEPPQSGNAKGGLLLGRPGIDTNLGRFTAGEFVMRREAVFQWGVDFMRAINAGLNPFRMSSIPAFAKGGLVGGQSNVTIQFPGLPPISGLRASSDTVEELRRAAAMAQVRSGGRKPSRYS